MTLCNTFRLFALTIVLFVIDTPANTFTISRTSDVNENIDHLEQAESISLQVRDDIRRPNDISVIKGDRFNPTTDSEIKDAVALTTVDSDNGFETLRSIDVATHELSNLGTTEISDKVNNIWSTNSGERKSSDDLETTENRHNEETTIPTVEASIDEVDHSKYEKYGQISQNVSLKEPSLPTWKKYTNINRKSSMESHDDFSKAKNRSEEMMTDETGTPVQDSKTGDIPSLNQIKNFLSFFKSDAQNDTKSSKEVTGQDSNSPTTDKETPATVESKRGGFLDFSLKSLFEDNDDKKDTSQETGTSRPKNRKLSWRIGSRYRAKDDSSAEKQGRSRFRLRNDDDKNKKEKNDIKTIKESQEENTKEVESREEGQIDNNRNRGRDRENKKEERKNTQDSKEILNKDNVVNVVNVMQPESKDDTVETTTINIRNDKEILKEWKDYGRKQESNQKINNNDSNEKTDRNTSGENTRSRQKNDKQTSKERIGDSDKGDRNRDRQSDNVNIWKTESSEDRSRSRYKNEQDTEQRNRQDQNQNRKEERNRSENNERQRNNDKTEEKTSRTRNDKENSRENNDNREGRNRSRSNNNDRNNDSRSRSNNNEENSRERSKIESRNNENRDETSRSRPRNNESRSRTRDDDKNSRERNSNSEYRKENNEDRDERNRSQSRSNNEANNESRSRSRNKEDSNDRSKYESRNENRDEKSPSRSRNNNDRNNESRSRSRDDERNSRERTIESRKESSEKRDDRYRSGSRNSNEKIYVSRKHEDTDIVSTQETYDKSDRRHKEYQVESSTSRYNTEKQGHEEIQTNVHTEAENVEQNNNLAIPKLDEITKKLSTIDEEDEPESELPTLLEDKITTSKPEYTEVQNIVAAKYPTDFKYTDIDTKQGSFDPKEPSKVTTTPEPTTTTQKRLELTTNENLEQKSKQEKETPSQEKSEINRGRITFKETVDLRGSTYEGNQYTESIPDIETEIKKETTTQPSSTGVDERKAMSSGDKGGSYPGNTKETEAIVQMNEEAIKEELMKEELINNYEENMGRYKGASETTTQTTIPVRIYEVTKPFNANDKSANVDEKLSVKPLSILEKLKTTILYPVSSNYKPPKKIDVQPPKTFVRDPDDNSWRNESLSSLGIVFNPKNSSKPLTQVLKNKTETELNNLSEKNNKNETPDLRVRLEKIAEMRKTKKKKTDAYGNIMYNDYEEVSRENNLSKENEMIERLTTPPIKLTSRLTTKMTTTTPAPTTTPVTPTTTTTRKPTTTQIAHTDVTQTTPKPTTQKPKKIFNVAKYYDTSDEDDSDYLKLAKLDLKKHTGPQNEEIITPPTWPITNNRVVHNKNDDRKPTVQYFPPLTTQKIIYNTDYNNDFNNKMKAYTYTEPPTNVLPVSYSKKTTAKPRIQHNMVFTPSFKSILDETPLTTKPIEFDKDFFMTPAPEVTVGREPFTFVTDDGSFNKASDVIKHYRDFLHAVAKDHEEDKNAGYTPYTQIPAGEVTGVTPYTKPFVKPDLSENYDYDTDYKKDALQRFVHNFNHHSDRFKVKLPLLYNNSIIHGAVSGEHGRDVASSRAYLGKLVSRPRDCDNATVELSPAYELHYYVPEQEEKEVADPKPVTIPYQYRL